MKAISFKIKNGKIEADYHGFVGNQCFEAEELIKSVLSKRFNADFVVKEYKPEYYQEEQYQQEEKYGEGY